MIISTQETISKKVKNDKEQNFKFSKKSGKK